MGSGTNAPRGLQGAPGRSVRHQFTNAPLPTRGIRMVEIRYFQCGGFNWVTRRVDRVDIFGHTVYGGALAPGDTRIGANA